MRHISINSRVLRPFVEIMAPLAASLFLLLQFSPAAAQGKCGNGIVDTGEDCDTAIEYSGRTCGSGCRWWAQCGNGYIEGAEECDDGPGNSDSTPGACRTSCEFAKCGDGTVDPNEQCDDASRNNNKIPGACRQNCRLPSCGDGVVDFSIGEQCEEGLGDTGIACFQCQTCAPVTDDLTLNQSGKQVSLCPGSYQTADSGEEGVLRVTGSGMIIDCDGATIIAEAPNLQRPDAIKAPVSPRDLITPPKKDDRKKLTPSKTKGGAMQLPQIAQTTYTRGTGILVTGNNNTLINCNVQNFRNGIKFVGTGNVLIGSDACRNATGIVALKGNNGARNTCNGSINNWSENGTSCSQTCP